ncbi:hypothetical protein VTN02DRAFT_1220 [Thermoascus thermophilus]
MALNPPTKRKNGPSGAAPGAQNSTAARKRAKTYDARAIAVQSADAALSATGELDVAAYVGAREFEIRALEAGMRKSKAALTSRAFQQVPRSLRRRTASHNVKRVPRRLRARARREMIEDNTPTVTARRRKPSEQLRLRLETARRLQNLNAKTKAKRAAAKAQRDKEGRRRLEDAGGHAYDIAPRVPKIKKNRLSRPPPPEAKFKKRQQAKTWLPTHMFHAKRAHMATSRDPLWRFAVPLTPTEKSYRPTHRAAGARGAVAWDVSYMSTIQLESTARGSVEQVLREMGVTGDEAWGAKGRRWREGTRSLQTWLLEREGTMRPIAPVTLIWCARRKAEDEEEDVEMVDADAEERTKAKKKKKPREKLFIRVHPSAFLQVWNQLLEVSKRQNPPVMVEDLRFEIGSIDITGPGSTEALIAALRPLADDGEEISKESPEATWSALLGVTNPSSLPQNALLAFSISHPSLHFPMQTMKPPSSESSMNELAILLSSWPPDRTQTAPSLFDRPARLDAVRRLPSQKAINRRRTLAGPGAHPAPQPTDPHIPVIILASRPQNQSQKNNSNSHSSQGTWTVLLPWKCVPPVWYAIMYYPLSSGSNPRFGGLKEQRQLAFELGEPWFPGDFPGTRAGWEWGLRERAEAKQEWERRPKGKRVEFGSIDLGDGQKGEIGRGWACDWERLVQGPQPDQTADGDTTAANAATKEEEEPPEDEDEKKKPDEEPIPPLDIHQLPADVAASIINHHHASGPLPAELQVQIDKPALATVKISLFNRGTPTPRARIYRLPTTNDDLRRRWLSLASPSTAHAGRAQPRQQQQRQQKQPQHEADPHDCRQRLAASLLSSTQSQSVDDGSSGIDGNDPHIPLPPEEDLIGFVTTGSYNLSEGRGTGIGSILVSKVVDAATGAGARGSKGRGKEKERRMCIVRAAGERVGRLGFWELV